MSYLDLLKLASPEAILVVAVLCVLGLGLKKEGASGICSFVAIVGLGAAAIAIFLLPKNATLFGGMLVINPLNSFFKILCLGLAAFTLFLSQQESSGSAPISHQGEYVAMILLATIGFLTEGYLTVLWFGGHKIGDRPLLLLGALEIILGIQFFSMGLIGEFMTYQNHKRSAPAELPVREELH